MAKRTLGIHPFGWIHIAVSSLLISLIFILNPFGVRDSAEIQYQHNVMRLVEPFYRKGNEHVTVVLIDTNFIDDNGGFPVTFNALYQLLKVMGRFEPQSVYFNFLQHYEHSPNLTRWLAAVERSPFPIWFASNPAHDDINEMYDINSIRSQLYSASHCRFSAVNWSGEGEYYPAYQKWQYLELINLNADTPMKIVGSAEGSVDYCNDSIVMHTPAFALYQDYCRHMPNTPSCLSWDRDETPGMLIRWRKHRLTHEESALNNTLQELTLMMTQGVFNEEELDSTMRVTQPPIDYLLASQLNSVNLWDSPEVKEKLSNRIILVGYLLDQNVDSVISPLHGTLPGTFRHAMALDNLIRYGQTYWHQPDEDVVWGLDFDEVIEFAVHLLAIVPLLYVRKTYVSLGQATSEWQTLFTNKNDLRNGLTGNQSDSTSQERYTLQVDTALELFKNRNRASLVLLFVPVMLIVSSIVASEFVFQFGIANWYALPIILLFSLPLMLEIVLCNLVITGMQKKSVGINTLRYSMYEKLSHWSKEQ